MQASEGSLLCMPELDQVQQGSRISLMNTPLTDCVPAADHAAARAPDWLALRTPWSMIGWRRKHELRDPARVLKYVDESKIQKQWQYWS